MENKKIVLQAVIVYLVPVYAIKSIRKPSHTPCRLLPTIVNSSVKCQYTAIVAPRPLPLNNSTRNNQKLLEFRGWSSRYLSIRSIIPLLHSSTAVSIRLPPAPPSHPLSTLLGSSAAWRSRLLCASSLCHLAMKQSAASMTPRYHFPLFLAALGRHTVSIPNSTGELSVDPLVA